MILCSNPKAQYLSHKAEIDSAVQKVMDKGWYILGEEVKLFESEFASLNPFAKTPASVRQGTEHSA